MDAQDEKDLRKDSRQGEMAQRHRGTKGGEALARRERLKVEG